MSIHNSDVFFAMPELKTLHALTVLDGKQRTDTLNIRPECYEDGAAAVAWLLLLVKDLEVLEATAHPAYLEHGKRAYRKLCDLWSVMTDQSVEMFPYRDKMGVDSPQDVTDILDAEAVEEVYNPEKENDGSTTVAVLWNINTGRVKFVSIGYDVADLTVDAEYYDPDNLTTKMILFSGMGAYGYPVTLYPKDVEQEFRYTLVKSINATRALEIIKGKIENRLKGEWTETELQDQFLEFIGGMIEYHSKGVPVIKEALCSFGFTLMTALDNGTIDFPGYQLIPNADDPEHRQDTELSGERPYPKDIPDIAGGLHERFFHFARE